MTLPNLTQPTNQLARCHRLWRLPAVGAVTLGLLLLIGTSITSGFARANTTAEADKLLVVDCLLPGQLRKLGRRSTFMSARRPVKTTARDCEIRGGEYTAYDRANYASALKMWLPLAEGGDVEAQINVGEIFEKGLGLPADYGAAAAWYRKAADLGSSRAAINLGNLYEQGLGVPKDSAQALQWYRRASGLPDAVVLDAGTLNEERKELAGLRAEVARSQEEITKLRNQLEKAQRQLETTRSQAQRRVDAANSERAKLAQARETAEQRYRSARQQSGGASSDTDLGKQLELRNRAVERKDAEVAALKAEVARLAAEAARRGEQLAELEQSRGAGTQALQAKVELRAKEAEFLRAELEQARVQIGISQARLKRQEEARTRDNSQTQQTRSEASSLKAQLGSAINQIAQLGSQLQRTSSELDSERARVDALSRQLDQERGRSKTDSRKVSTLEQALSEHASAAQEQQANLEKLRNQFATVRKQAEGYRGRLEAMEVIQVSSLEAKSELALAGPPVIELLDPKLVLTRSATPEVVLRSIVPAREVVGKVIAPAGLASLAVNDAPSQPNVAGVFRASVAIGGERTPVTIVAVDRGGNRTALSFDLLQKPAPSNSTAVVSAPAAPKGEPLAAAAVANLGHYHALVIGIDEYAALPRLNTAVSDARAVASLLSDRYGFKTKLIVNAGRFEILSALNEMRETLTENDNLLIYYAGHGELDRRNQRGHWLPNDAVASSSANWISNVAVTDVINVMNAKQIMVVADSCYSGALTRSALGNLRAGMSVQARERWIKVMANKRSRTVLTSGGEQPVLDGVGGKHSVFAAAFLEVLGKNQNVLEGGRLFSEVADRVRRAIRNTSFDQTPQYAPLRHAGHEGGDFFFVPQS